MRTKNANESAERENISNETVRAEWEGLSDADLERMTGGFLAEAKAEAQIFQALSSAVSDVMKNFGGALQTASRG